MANDDINLSVEKGEIHALLGENGAGKSTLMNVLYGMYKQSEGEIWLDGKMLQINNPNDAINNGIGMVHQHFMMVPPLTVIENVMLGLSKGEYKKLDLKKAAEEFTAMAEKYGLSVSPWSKVSELTVGEQQRVEILKALFRKSQLIILDEPTAVLTPSETEKLFDLLRQLTQSGLTILFITHKLGEVMDICDKCTVLRQGKMVASLKISEITGFQQLASLMVGKDVDLVTHKGDAKAGDAVLQVEGLSYKDNHGIMRVEDLYLTVHSGEIVGIAGVDGNGQSELVRCITGLLKPTSGRIQIGNDNVTGKNPKQILKHEVSHIPEDRHKMAMIKQMSVKENLILMNYDQRPFSKNGILDWKWIASNSEKICKEYDVRTQSIEEEAGRLSGGNQQKFVVGRELNRNPKLLIAVYPSRGLDIGATKYIQARLIEERDRGAAVLLVSTELDEVMDLSDHIAVMNGGRIMGIMPQKEAKREKIGLLMAGIQGNEAAEV